MKRILSIAFCLTMIYSMGLAQHFDKKLENPFTKYRVSTNTCTKIIHSSGSIIFIPDHAFDFRNDTSIDSVTIYYREIRTPLDILAHDIPMMFTLMNKQYFLESSGMFEIWSMNGSDTINIHEDRSIEVRMAVSPSRLDIRTEGYKLNPGSSNWESYTSRLGFNSVNNEDDDLWGSDPVNNEILLEEEDGTLWATADSIRDVAFQVMEIFDFGIYNYDRIIENQIYVKLKANFVDENEAAIKSTVYVVYDDINSVFEYPEYSWGNEFSIIKDKSYKLFSIDGNGKILTLTDFPDLNSLSNQAHTFQLKTRSKVPATKQELAQITGIR